MSCAITAPYSPKLNPIESPWHYLKSHFWRNRDYDALEQAAMNVWRLAVLDEALVQTVRAAPYTKRATSD